MLDVGDRVPDFSIPLAFADGRRSPVAFQTLLQNGPVVIAFYPLAFTGVCTKELCEVRDRQAALSELGATVVGFSADTPHSNLNYARMHGFTHGLYSDANRVIIDALWETMTVAGVERSAKRGWFVIDRNGIVAEKWITDDPEEWSGLAPIEAALSKLA